MIARKIGLISFFVFVFFFFLFFSLLHFFPLSRVCFGKSCLQVEIAQTPKKRAQGLMFRAYLPSSRGMLFIFPEEDFWSFWMKDTLIPLDIIWMDAKGRIVDIVENAKPWSNKEVPPSFNPVSRAFYVLEANAGFVTKHRIKIGDQVRFKWIFSSKPL